jgi:hypothetical protein
MDGLDVLGGVFGAIALFLLVFFAVKWRGTFRQLFRRKPRLSEFPERRFWGR